MAHSRWSPPTRRPLPIILIGGFGGFDVTDEQKQTYQGFNDGSVYPQKQGENYIYEGMILRFMKSDWRYQDATNVVGYYSREMDISSEIPGELRSLNREFFCGRMIIDPAMALRFLRSQEDLCRSLWVFRYYDLGKREFRTYGEALVRLIDCIRAITALQQGGIPPKVNIIAHSMGGLIVREAIQCTYPRLRGAAAADEAINKIVTLGTPHKGIPFQVVRNLHWLGIEAANELEHFNPENQSEEGNPAAFINFHRCFPADRLLTVVGTNYRTFNNKVSSALNRLFSESKEQGANYNRSDGVVKQTSAQIDPAPRAFLHKCHAGYDSLLTSRETFEVATRFLFGNVRVRLRQVQARVLRGFDLFGKSEFFLGVSVKPRGVDFELFHQSKAAENCYGPFRAADFSDRPTDLVFPWAGSNQLIWEGYLNSSLSSTRTDLILRLDFYVGERDLFGLGFSDNVIFYKQYYLRMLFNPTLHLYLYTGEEFASHTPLRNASLTCPVEGGWEFDVNGTGFRGTYRIELEAVPEVGNPVLLWNRVRVGEAAANSHQFSEIPAAQRVGKR